MKITSVACRVADVGKDNTVGGHGGWYGQAGEKCPKCGRTVVVTGQFESVDL